MSGIPADAFESEQVFCSPALLTKTLSAFLSLKMRVSSRATPSFFPPAAPSGITHYTFVPKVVCQRGLPPPLETLLALSEMGTHRAFRVATFPPNPQNKNGVSCHCVTAMPLCFVLRLPLAAGAHLRMSADYSQMRFSIILFYELCCFGVARYGSF